MFGFIKYAAQMTVVGAAVFTTAVFTGSLLAALVVGWVAMCAVGIE